jgi:shikimate kinase
MKDNGANRPAAFDELRRRIGRRSIVMVGLMGCGKSSVGRRLAIRLGLPFVDADDEIEKAAGKSIPDIFADYGEAHFRDRECRVILRLLDSGPQVLATGGGAFMRGETRDAIARFGISIWLKAELPVLMARVMRREDRPLLKTADPTETMRKLMEERYPIYEKADIAVQSRDASHDEVVRDIIEALGQHLAVSPGGEG